jgi:hypothetical protein
MDDEEDDGKLHRSNREEAFGGGALAMLHRRSGSVVREKPQQKQIEGTEDGRYFVWMWEAGQDPITTFLSPTFISDVCPFVSLQSNEPSVGSVCRKMDSDKTSRILHHLQLVPNLRGNLVEIVSRYAGSVSNSL